VTGRQADVSVIGSQNETLAAYLIGGLAGPVKVPREHDFGIDFFCQLYSQGGAKSVGSDELFAMQVKGGTGGLHYGGLRDDKWLSYEIGWLRSVMVPLFLGRVHENPGTLELYSLGPVWRVFWQSAEPFKIECVTNPASTTIVELPEVERKSEKYLQGDGTCWSVPLGPPLLCLTDAQLADQSFVSNAKYVLRRQIGIERRNLLYFFQGVAVHERLASWATNDFISQAVYHRAMYWDMTPGKNISALAAVVAPGVVNLGIHLQWQDDRDAYRLIDVLEWLQCKGALDGVGDQLLKGLRTTRDLNIGPAPDGHGAK
jgi:hypothetical protein